MNGEVAQWPEQGTHKPFVEGSTPSLATKKDLEKSPFSFKSQISKEKFGNSLLFLPGHCQKLTSPVSIQSVDPVGFEIVNGEDDGTQGPGDRIDPVHDVDRMGERDED